MSAVFLYAIFCVIVVIIVKSGKKNKTTSFRSNMVSETLNDIDNMEGHNFEYYCADLLKKNGFSKVVVTPGSGDQGVDIIAVKDGVKYALQCKKYSSALSNKPVQEVAAGKYYYGCDVGIVLTNSTFTAGAINLAKATNTILWDRHDLARLIQNTMQVNSEETTQNNNNNKLAVVAFIVIIIGALLCKLIMTLG